MLMNKRAWNQRKREYAGIVQLVEHLLAKEKVASSSLAARSFFYRGLCPLYGDVAKWQGKGLQNPHHRFKSDRRLWKSLEREIFSFKCLSRRNRFFDRYPLRMKIEKKAVPHFWSFVNRQCCRFTFLFGWCRLFVKMRNEEWKMRNGGVASRL